ncbi:MAG TPA: hypothetical protein VK183_10530, partial [Flavobacterium sp.]|nr:hypothetical protein [Flavobacterium sp.]
FLLAGANYFLAASAGAAVVSAAAAVVSAAGAAVVSAGASGATAVVSAAASVFSASFLQETTVRAAIAITLKITFFILLKYKRLIINSWQR